MAKKRPTIADLRSIKGKRQLTMLRVLNLDEAEAAERAGIDIVSIPPELMMNPQYRDAAPSLFSMPGDNFFEIGTADDFVRWAFRLYKAGADRKSGFPHGRRTHQLDWHAARRSEPAHPAAPGVSLTTTAKHCG